MLDVVATFEHLVDLFLRLVYLSHRVGRVTAVAITVARCRAPIAEVSSVAKIAEALLPVEKSTATVTAPASATAIIEAAAASIAETIVVLIVVEAVPVLEIAAAAVVRIVESLEARLVVRAAIIVRPELSLTIVAPVARPTASATSRVRSGP